MLTSHKTRSNELGLPEADAQRFWAKVLRADAGCWIWTGSLMTRGYGQFFLNGRPEGAHRVAWMLTHGPIPAGQEICHRCDNPACVRPDHLFLGTHTENVQDATKKGRLHAPRPSRQKVTDEQVDEMVALVRSGRTQRSVAREHGVSEAFVSRVMLGTARQWRKVA